MAVNPGFDGTLLTEPVTAEVAAARTQMAILGEGGKQVKISQFALFYPGVSRRKVLTLLDALTDDGYLKKHLQMSPNGKGSWNYWTLAQAG